MNYLISQRIHRPVRGERFLIGKLINNYKWGGLVGATTAGSRRYLGLGRWVPGFSLVLDGRVEPSLPVGYVAHYLESAVGKLYLVLAFDLITVAHCVVGVIGSVVVVFHCVIKIVRHSWDVYVAWGALSTIKKYLVNHSINCC